MTYSSKMERLQIVLTAEELDTLDDWRFTHRMPSRAAAIRELIKRGLAHSDGEAPNARRSRDVRIVEHRTNGSNGAHSNGSNGAHSK
ncbi:MAG TPA: hypothetical protein VFA12_19600 [Stellaceae bacterium]|nr:hypothetical protein [Stellaceae bacterium]